MLLTAICSSMLPGPNCFTSQKRMTCVSSICPCRDRMFTSSRITPGTASRIFGLIHESTCSQTWGILSRGVTDSRSCKVAAKNLLWASAAFFIHQRHQLRTVGPTGISTCSKLAFQARSRVARVATSPNSSLGTSLRNVCIDFIIIPSSP